VTESESIIVPADDASWMHCYTMAIDRYELVCLAVFQHLANRLPFAELVDYVADSMNGCDCVDGESIDLYRRAKAAAEQDDHLLGIRR
jgi:3,4-dihydroxy-2-butanone 4-phosphate synthase